MLLSLPTLPRSDRVSDSLYHGFEYPAPSHFLRPTALSKPGCYLDLSFDGIHNGLHVPHKHDLLHAHRPLIHHQLQHFRQGTTRISWVRSLFQEGGFPYYVS